jgi:hypothetical protein
MGANGDAEYLTTSSAPDFLMGTQAHLGALPQGARDHRLPLGMNATRVSNPGANNPNHPRVYPARIGPVHPTRVDPAVQVKVNAGNLPFGSAGRLDALGAAASVVPQQIASGRTGPLR